MGLQDRVSRTARANLTDMSANPVDPKQVLDQLLLDMQEDLAQARQALVNAMATHRRTQQQHTSALAEVDQWQKRAHLALVTGKEELVRQALMRKNTFTNNAATLKTQLEQQASTVERLKRNLIAYETKMTEAKERKSVLQSRVDAVETKVQPQKIIGGSIAGKAATNFENFGTALIVKPRLQITEALDRADLEVLLGEIDESSDVEAELAKLGAMLGFTKTQAEQPKLLEATHDNAYEVLVALNQLERKLQKVMELSQEATQELAELKIQFQNSRKVRSGIASYDSTIDVELAALQAKLDQL